MIGWVLGVLVLVPVFAVLAAVLLLNLDPGRRLVERLAGQLTGGQVAIAGLRGRFPDALRLRACRGARRRGRLADRWTTWRWTGRRLALLHREARIDLLQAGRVQVPRLPVSSRGPAAPASDAAVHAAGPRVGGGAARARAEIGAPVAGVPPRWRWTARRTWPRCRTATRT